MCQELNMDLPYTSNRDEPGAENTTTIVVIQIHVQYSSHTFNRKPILDHPA